MKSRFVVSVALLAGAVSVLCVTSPARAGNGTPYYFDVNGATPGFGSPSGTYNASGNNWSTDSTGSSATAGLPNNAQLTFGATGTDLAGSTFTINLNIGTFIGVAVNGASANVTLVGTTHDYLNGGPETWYVAAGSTLTEAQTYNGYGLDFNGQTVTLTGGGTINWNAALDTGSLFTQNGPVVNLQPAATAVGFAGNGGYTLTSGTLNFANANAFANLPTSSGGTLTISDSNGLGVIDNTSGSSGTLSNIGVIRVGGNFTFNGTNPLNFGTGAVALTNTNASTATITVNSNTLTIGGPISGTNELAVAGAGTLVLSSSLNSYSGGTLISSGTLALGNSLALQNSVLDTSGTGMLSFGVFGSATLAGLANTGGSLALNNAAATAGVTLLVGNNGTSSTYPGTLSGSGGLTKIGAGTLTLTGSNTYTGLTTASAGTLNLNFAAATAPAANIISGSSTLALTGGNLTLTGSSGASNSQAFNALNVIGGANQVTLNATGGYNNLLLSLGTIARSPGGTVNFTLPPGTPVGVTTSAVNTTNTILGGWATVNGNDWATVSGGNIVGLATLGGYTETSAAGTTPGNYTNADIDVDISAGLIAGPISPNSLRFNTTGGGMLTLAAGNNTIASGGILVTSSVGNYLSTITGGTLQGASGGDLTVMQNNTSNSLAINSVIADNGGATGLTKSGPGTLLLYGANTFSGGVFIDAGTLQLHNSGALGAGSVTVNAGTLDLYGYSPTIGALSGNPGAVIANTGGAGTLTINTSTATTFAGTIQNAINLVQTGAGLLTLTGSSNNYNGTTTINGGTLQVGNGGPSYSLGSNGSAVVVNGALVYNEGTLTVNNPLSGSGTVSNVGATGVLTINKNIAMTGSGGFALNGVGLAMANGLNLSVVNGTGTINSASPTAQFYFGTGTLAANGTGSINISATSSAGGGGGALCFGGATLTTSGNVNLSGMSPGGAYGTQDQSSNTSITALSGTTTLTGDSTTNAPVFFAYNNTVTLTANPGAAIVWQGGAHSGLGRNIFYDYGTGATTFNISGSVSFVSASPDPTSTFWSASASATNNNWAVFNVAAGGALTLNAGISSMSNAINVNSSGTSVTIAGSGTGTSSGTMAINSGSLIYNISAPGALTQSTSGLISGGGAVSMIGNGLLILTGSNTYTGGTTINAGTLQIGAGSNAGSLANAVSNTINDNGVLAFDRNDVVTYATSISGSGSVVQMGSGTLYLTGVNSYTGTTTVSHGILEPANTGAMPGYATPGLVTVASGGTLAIASGPSGWAAGDLSTLLSNNGAGFAGGSSLGIDTTGGSLALSTNISGGMGLTKLGSSTLALSGTNTYLGKTTVAAGTLQAASPNALGNVFNTGYLSVASSATLMLGAGGSGWQGSDISSLLTFNPSAFASGSYLAIDTTGGSVTYNNALSGNMGLVKLGPNALVLSSAPNTYLGGTTISGGTLQVGNGTTSSELLGPSSAAVVANGALVYDQATLTVNNPISGTGTVSDFGATGQLTIAQPIAMTGSGGFTLSGTSSSSTAAQINSGVNLSVVDGVGTILSVSTTTGQFYLNGVNSLSASGTGSINISAQIGVNTGGQGALILGGGLLTTSGNVNLSGIANTSGMGIQMQSSNNSITALSGTTTLSGDSASGQAFAFQYGNTVTLTADPGAVIVLTGGANSGTGIPIFRSYDNQFPGRATTFDISGAVSFVSASADPTSTFWAAQGNALWPTFNVADGGALTLNAGVSKIGNGLMVSSSGASSVTIAGSATGTMTGTMSISGSLIYDISAPGVLTQSTAGVISGAGAVINNGTGMLILDALNDYANGTTINGGTLQVGNAYALGTGSLAVDGNGTLDLHGFSPSITTLGGSGTIVNNASLSRSSMLTVTDGGAFSGFIQDGAHSTALTVVGGTLILSGTDNYTGGTDVEGGTLEVASSTAIPYGSGLVVGSGGTVVFSDPPQAEGTMAATFAASPAGRVAAVPEPGTLALLAVALWSAAACYRFSRRPDSRQTNR